MLSTSDNERLTRVGPGTPMGQIRCGATGCRRRSRPSCRSRMGRRCACGCWAKIWSPSATPTARSVWSTLFVRIAARRCSSAATKGTGCAASITAGNSIAPAIALDLPTEPPDSSYKTRIKIEAYPTAESGGIVWTYMGPPAHMPPAPDWELTRDASQSSLRLQDHSGLQLAADARRRPRIPPTP